jgi:hypothetical protein
MLMKSNELSGKVEFAECVCYECGKKFKELMPIEYADNPDAWRIDGRLALHCGCVIKPKKEENSNG